MIDFHSEQVICLREAAEWLPKRSGKRPHIATLYRWAKHGVRGVRLETVKVGGRVCTSVEALGRFIEETNPAGGPVDLAGKAEERRQRTRKLLDDAGL